MEDNLWESTPFVDSKIMNEVVEMTLESFRRGVDRITQDIDKLDAGDDDLKMVIAFNAGLAHAISTIRSRVGLPSSPDIDEDIIAWAEDVISRLDIEQENV